MDALQGNGQHPFIVVYLRNTLRLVILWLSTLGFGEAQVVGEIVVSTRSNDHPTAVFDYWASQGKVPATQVLLLVPGYNGSGPQMFTLPWKDFAGKYHLILLAPTFTTICLSR